MAHDPGHTEHHHGPKSYDRAFAIGIALNLIYVAFEATFGVLAGSLALIAKALIASTTSRAPTRAACSRPCSAEQPATPPSTQCFCGVSP
jgi:hypothetical protein